MSIWPSICVQIEDIRRRSQFTDIGNIISHQPSIWDAHVGHHLVDIVTAEFVRVYIVYLRLCAYWRAVIGPFPFFDFFFAPPPVTSLPPLAVLPPGSLPRPLSIFVLDPKCIDLPTPVYWGPPCAAAIDCVGPRSMLKSILGTKNISLDNSHLVSQTSGNDGVHNGRRDKRVSQNEVNLDFRLFGFLRL